MHLLQVAGAEIIKEQYLKMFLSQYLCLKGKLVKLQIGVTLDSKLGIPQNPQKNVPGPKYLNSWVRHAI